MKLLLDTNAFLFAVANQARLSETVRETLVQPDVPRLLSVVSLWEIMIKSQIGKLPASLPSFFEDQARDLGAQLLPLHARHIRTLGDLPRHHKDPFDRMLIAQAIEEHLTIVTSDRAFAAYPVQTIW